MKFTEQTIQLLEKMMDDLDLEAGEYKWDTSESDVLLEFIEFIEAIMYLGNMG